MKGKIRNIKLNKIIIIMLIIALISIIFPQKVSAISWKTKFGGDFLQAVFKFLDFIGDTIMNLLQKNFISQQPALIEANSTTVGNWNWATFILTIIGIIAIVVGIFITKGALANIGVAGITSILKGVCVGTLWAVGGTATALVGGETFTAELLGEFDIPMIEYTPYTIFSGQVPAFDINFIKPKDDIVIQNDYYQGEEFTNLPMENEDYDISILRDSKLWKLFLNFKQDAILTDPDYEIGILQTFGELKETIVWKSFAEMVGEDEAENYPKGSEFENWKTYIEYYTSAPSNELDIGYEKILKKYGYDISSNILYDSSNSTLHHLGDEYGYDGTVGGTPGWLIDYNVWINSQELALNLLPSPQYAPTSRLIRCVRWNINRKSLHSFYVLLFW